MSIVLCFGVVCLHFDTEVFCADYAGMTTIPKIPKKNGT